MFPNANSVTTPNPALILDGTYLIGTRQVWRYKLPILYNYIPANSSPGYPVTITAGTTNAEGCGNSFERDFDLAVYDPPSANYTWTNNGCITDSVRFTDATIYLAGTYSYKWYWNFGDGKTDSISNPVHLFTTPGTHPVKFSLISNVGCLSDTMTKFITISPLPVATMTGSTAVCKNAVSPVITFKGVTGTAPFKFTYKINGGPDLTVTATSGNIATVSLPTTVTGTFTYTLVGVQGENCYKAQAATATVIINPLPAATITGTTAVCQNSASPLITFTGSGATAPYKFIYKINGGANLTVTSTSGPVATVPVPTTTVGTYTYTLVSVQDASTISCIQNQAGSATVTVNRLPTALISGTAATCLNSASPLITFTGANGTAPYIFTYNINGGGNLTATTTSGNSVAVPAPSTTAGTFTYTLISVKESGATACMQPQPGTAIITIYPLPVADFTFALPACASKTVTFSDASLPNAGSLNQWHWNFGDGSPISALRNPTHTFILAGTYSVKLYVSTSNGCQSIELVKPVIINPRPVAGFIDPEVCLSDTYAQFNDTSRVSGGTVTSWLWNFGDPGSGGLNTSALQNPTHAYNTIGTKNVQLISTSLSGCKDTVTQSFFVNGDIPVAGLAVINATGLCANDSVTVENRSTVNVGSVVKVEICWDNAGAPATFETDDNPAPNKRYTHLYPNFQNPPLTKNYRIRFRAYSGATCVNDKYQDIVLNATPKVLFNDIPDTCLYVTPFQVLQAGEVSGVPGTFLFSGPGITPAGLFNPALVGPGSYTLTYTYTSNRGCVDSGKKVIRILQPPVANFGFSKPACQTNAILFSDSSQSSTGAIVSWIWNFGDGSSPVIRNSNIAFSHTYTATGTYDVTLMVTNTSGCASTIKHIPVTVAPLPVVNFSFTDTACLPNAIIRFRSNSSIADNTENTFIFTWDFGDGSPLSYSPTPVHIYPALGPYTVLLKIRSGAQCIAQKSLTVNTIHPRPVAGFDFNKPGICAGEQVGLTDQSDPKDGSALLWPWDFGDSNISGEENPVHTYTNAGTFIVKHYIRNSFGCISDTLPKPFSVYPYPVVNAGDDKVVLEGGTITLISTASGNDLRYSWTRDGSLTSNLHLNSSTILSPASSPVEDMNYTLTVTGRGGCISADNVKVTVLKAPKIPNTFSPNSDGINDSWEILYLETYPLCRVQVFTRTGQLVFSSNGYKKPWDGTMKGKSLPVDTYYYIIEPQSGRKPLTGYVTIIK